MAKQRLNRNKQKKKPFYKRLWVRVFGIALIVGTLITWILNAAGLFDVYERVTDRLKTDEEKFREHHYIKGILIPRSVQATQKEVKIKYGLTNQYMALDSLRDGIEKSPPGIDIGYPIVKLKLNGDTLSVTSSMFDLKTEQIIGKVVSNKWELFSPNISNYHSTNQFFEVIDLYDNVVYSVAFELPNVISIHGYFISPTHVIVINQGMSVIGKGSPDALFSIDQAVKAIPKRHKY